ncbi:MAG: acyl-CoA reductase [Bacteroidota bacterium]
MYLTKRIEGLTSLQNTLSKKGIPEEVMEESLLKNPWFTPYYITHSLSSILPWLAEDVLATFTHTYKNEIENREPKKVGIIMAGNLPFVGFHDLLIGILSKNELYLSFSHQDEILMKWVLESWIEADPDIEKLIYRLPTEANLDFLLATGSDNTARYLKDAYQNTPRLIRQNRYSVAVLDDFVTDSDLEELAKDILLYNGLGCRNVSNVICMSDFDIERLLNKIRLYPKKLLNSLFLEKIQFERVRMNMLGEDFADAGNCLLTYSEDLRSVPMGLLNCVKITGQAALEGLFNGNVNKIQCMVNKGTKFGDTQCPTISDFADGIDTLKILTEV